MKVATISAIAVTLVTAQAALAAPFAGDEFESDYFYRRGGPKVPAKPAHLKGNARTPMEKHQSAQQNLANKNLQTTKAQNAKTNKHNTITRNVAKGALGVAAVGAASGVAAAGVNAYNKLHQPKRRSFGYDSDEEEDYFFVRRGKPAVPAKPAALKGNKVPSKHESAMHAIGQAAHAETKAQNAKVNSHNKSMRRIGAAALGVAGVGAAAGALTTGINAAHKRDLYQLESEDEWEERDLISDNEEDGLEWEVRNFLDDEEEMLYYVD